MVIEVVLHLNLIFAEWSQERLSDFVDEIDPMLGFFLFYWSRMERGWEKTPNDSRKEDIFFLDIFLRVEENFLQNPNKLGDLRSSMIYDLDLSYISSGVTMPRLNLISTGCVCDSDKIYWASVIDTR